MTIFDLPDLAMETQMLLNGGLFVFLSVRYEEKIMAPENRWILITLLAAIFVANAFMMWDRFEVSLVLYKSAMIAFGFLLVLLFLKFNRVNHERRRSKE